MSVNDYPLENIHNLTSKTLQSSASSESVDAQMKGITQKSFRVYKFEDGISIQLPLRLLKFGPCSGDGEVIEGKYKTENQKEALLKKAKSHAEKISTN